MAGLRGCACAGSLNRREYGIALVIVLWMVVMFTVMAGSFAFAMRQETVLTGNQRSLAQAEALADAGVYRAVYELAMRAPDNQGWQANGVPHQFELGGGSVRVVALDESGKIDLNMAPDVLIGGLLTVEGIGDEEKSRILDAILDWRDPDNIKRAYGAEEDDYRAAGRDYVPRNGPFTSVRELNLVLGVTPAIYRRLAPYLTVYSGLGINPLLASRDVLLSIPGLTPSGVETYLAQRSAAQASGSPPPAFPESSAFIGTMMTQVASIRAEARVADGATFIRDATMRLTMDATRPVLFLEWKEGENLVAKTNEATSEVNVK